MAKIDFKREHYSISIVNQLKKGDFICSEHFPMARVFHKKINRSLSGNLAFYDVELMICDIDGKTFFRHFNIAENVRVLRLTPAGLDYMFSLGLDIRSELAFHE